jgi:leader peptidase (prepilin peptidase)/N-methyltransferase
MPAFTIAALPQELMLLLFFTVFTVAVCIGSFLNVVIYRLPIMLQMQWHKEARSILIDELAEADAPVDEVFNLALPHSCCPNCKEKIRFWQNIPILSFLLLRGRCYYCKQPISWRYPAVEFITGVAIVLVFLQYGLSAQFFWLSILTFAFIALVGIDFDHQLLPDAITLPLLWLGLLLNTQALYVSLSDAVIGAAAGYLVLWSIFWLFKLVTGKDGMGYGDFKLLAVVGAWFGWQILANVILLSSVVGALVGGALILLLKRDSQKPMPFGPFLAIAAWLCAMYPSYTSLLNYL